MNETIWPLALLVLVGCGAAATSGAAEPQLRAAKQATPTGAELYAAECASCHGERGQGSDGNPAVMGPGALPVERADRPAFRNARDLHGYIAAKMPLPPQFAGSLSDAEYWALTSFILRAHGAAVPDEGLSPANADGVSIQP